MNDLVCFGRIGIIVFKILLSAKDISRSRGTRTKIINSMLVKFRTPIIVEALITVTAIKTKKKKKNDEKRKKSEKKMLEPDS